MSKAEHAKSDHEGRIVKGETVKQKLFDAIGIHAGIPYPSFRISVSNIDYFLKTP
jgi:hypothetical protein